MVSKQDIVMIEQHIAARWPNHRPWEQPTRLAWFEELEKYPTDVVWSAVRQHKSEHPPSVMEVVGVVRRSMHIRDFPALPRSGVVSLGDWLESAGYSSVDEAKADLA